MHAAPANATPDHQRRLDEEVKRHRLSIIKRQLCNPDISAYVAYYNGYPAAFSMWAITPGTVDLHRLSHRRRPTTLYEKFLRLWYKVIDYCISWVPDAVQTSVWFPTLGHLYLARRKMIMQQQTDSVKKFLDSHKEDVERGYRTLYFLGTLPEYERKGLGSALLKQGLREAKQDEITVLLGATPAGKPLYERNGFEILSVETKGEEGVCTWQECIMGWRQWR